MSFHTGLLTPKVSSKSIQWDSQHLADLMSLNGTKLIHSSRFKIRLIHYLHHSDYHSDNYVFLYLFLGLQIQTENIYILLLSIALVSSTSLSI